MVPRPAASPGNLLDTKIHCPHPRLTEFEASGVGPSNPPDDSDAPLHLRTNAPGLYVSTEQLEPHGEAFSGGSEPRDQLSKCQC